MATHAGEADGPTCRADATSADRPGWETLHASFVAFSRIVADGANVSATTVTAKQTRGENFNKA